MHAHMHTCVCDMSWYAVASAAAFAALSSASLATAWALFARASAATIASSAAVSSPACGAVMHISICISEQLTVITVHDQQAGRLVWWGCGRALSGAS